MRDIAQHPIDDVARLADPLGVATAPQIGFAVAEQHHPRTPFLKSLKCFTDSRAYPATATAKHRAGGGEPRGFDNGKIGN